MRPHEEISRLERESPSDLAINLETGLVGIGKSGVTLNTARTNTAGSAQRPGYCVCRARPG